MNQTYYTIEIAIGAISIGLSLLGLIGAAASAISANAATKTLVETGEIEADASQAEIQAAFKELLENPPTKRSFIGQAGLDALEMLNSAAVNINEANT